MGARWLQVVPLEAPKATGAGQNGWKMAKEATKMRFDAILDRLEAGSDRLGPFGRIKKVKNFDILGSTKIGRNCKYGQKMPSQGPYQSHKGLPAPSNAN